MTVIFVTNDTISVIYTCIKWNLLFFFYRALLLGEVKITNHLRELMTCFQKGQIPKKWKVIVIRRLYTFNACAMNNKIRGRSTSQCCSGGGSSSSNSCINKFVGTVEKVVVVVPSSIRSGCSSCSVVFMIA